MLRPSGHGRHAVQEELANLHAGLRTMVAAKRSLVDCLRGGHLASALAGTHAAAMALSVAAQAHGLPIVAHALQRADEASCTLVRAVQDVAARHLIEGHAIVLAPVQVCG